MKDKIKPYLVNTVVLIVSLVMGGVLTEVGFRIILFSDIAAFASLRKPDNYADYFSDDDYWKLLYHFGRKPRANPHPILGWVSSDFSGETYLHNDAQNVRDQRPVLLYGDSFAHCVREVLCFQDILNKDEEFSKKHYLLNYGVGSYGLDQIYLLFQYSVHHYDNPYVVISFMTLDLDRSVLSVRSGQKPYFGIKDDELQLAGVPINPNPYEYFAENPVRIKSYVYRRLLYGYLSNDVVRWLRPGIERVNEKKAINEKILDELIKELRANDIDFVFVVFHPHWPGVSTLDRESDWRDPFVKQILEENDVPYIWTKTLFQQEVASKSFNFDDYILPVDGHPTTNFNRLIAVEIKKHVLDE